MTILFIAVLGSGSYIVPALTHAYMFRHYVLIGPNQLPQFHQEAPQAFIYNSNGIILAIIEADDGEQIWFVIDHELGHHVTDHLNGLKHFLQLPGHLIHFLGKAYSRSRELTCDRVGAFVA
ncbi:M48 family metalloprotease [Commensalibacter communis]|uniref:hypothetical protein n=1 Tax=Commensalibacter communis TaxID=2972786 RepID=UPI0023308B8E|nr:hypothetical protein [Commensalibacter communis]